MARMLNMYHHHLCFLRELDYRMDCGGLFSLQLAIEKRTRMLFYRLDVIRLLRNHERMK
jgi:hypothetical protein